MLRSSVSSSNMPPFRNLSWREILLASTAYTNGKNHSYHNTSVDVCIFSKCADVYIVGIAKDNFPLATIEDAVTLETDIWISWVFSCSELDISYFTRLFTEKNDIPYSNFRYRFFSIRFPDLILANVVCKLYFVSVQSIESNRSAVEALDSKSKEYSHLKA